MDSTVDILLKGGQLIDVNSRTIQSIDIGIKDGLFNFDATCGETEIELNGSYISPGFIDAHMHVESTMLPPASFANLAIPHGTTAVVLDPHEIANVLGIVGIELLMQNAKDLPIDCFFTASSCVPASSLETSGATLLADDLEPLFQQGKVIALAEMMNYPGVIQDDPEVMAKISMGLRYGKVDGHCPGLKGEQLKKYINAGISSDHESTTADEALEKLELGMQIYIREGSAAKNLEALLPIITPENASQICFCTDDRHPADLINEGHIDHIVRKAIKFGIEPVLAISIATKHAANHYELKTIGSIEHGKKAHFILFDDLQNIKAKEVWHSGRRVAANGKMQAKCDSNIKWDVANHTVRLPKNFTPKSFAIQDESTRIRVIKIIPGQLITEELHMEAHSIGGEIVANADLDMLKMAVIERHHQTGNIGLGFVKGFQFKNGAIASTVGHDAHNLAIVGDNDSDMHLAAKTLEEAGGGQCVVSKGEIKAVLPLTIAGLMSEEDYDVVIEQQTTLLNTISSLGCPLKDPFMPLSFLPLSVIPKLKLSDLGLIDVEQFRIVPLGVDK